MRWLTVPYNVDDQNRSFMERAQTQTLNGVEVTVAVQSDLESRRFFGVRMARKGIQPVWIQVVNKTEGPIRLDQFRIDHSYYTPLEAAYVNHFSIGKRLASFWSVVLVVFSTVAADPVQVMGGAISQPADESILQETWFFRRAGSEKHSKIRVRVYYRR